MRYFPNFLAGVFFIIFYSWSPAVSLSDGQNKKPVVSSADTTGASIHERLEQAELELFRLKRQRHELIKALEQKRNRRRPIRKLFPKDQLRRPCT